MIFRKQAFLGQVPFSTPMGRITSGASTYTAQKLCALLKSEMAQPGTVSSKQIAEEWGRVSGVKEMEDDTKYHMNAWCPGSVALLDQMINQPYKVFDPSKEKERASAYMAPPPPKAPVRKVVFKETDATREYKPPEEIPGLRYPPTPTPGGGRGKVEFTNPPRSWPLNQPVPTPSNVPYRQQMTRDQLIRSALTLGPSGSAPVSPLTSMPAGYGQMPVMNGPRVRIVNLGGSNEDLAWFEANRLQLAQQYPNQFVIIKDLAVHGAYPDFQSAYNAGVTMFGTQPFEVKQAVGQQPTEYA